MPAKVILIVEDEKAIRDMIAFGLRRGGFEIREAQDCRAARTEIAGRRPDLLLVDWMLPDMTGLEFTRQLKRDPTRELMARIQAVLRRVDPAVGGEIVDIEGLRLDPVAHRVTAGDKPVTLGPTEYRMLEFFMTHPDRVYSREQLLDRIWGGNVYVEERTIDVHIRRLRKALEEFGYDRLVQTVRGAGYRFSGRGE
jgi:two-component system phosphate regulon response regulator PhoB